MTYSDVGKIDSVSKSEPVPTNGLPNLAELAPSTLESPQGAPSPFRQPTLSRGILSADEEYPSQWALSGRTDNKAKKQPEPPDTSLIYVDYSVPAVLRYSETMAIYLTLREAIAAWLALPNVIKKDASIKTDENSGGSRYQGWEIYRLWEHWNS